MVKLKSPPMYGNFINPDKFAVRQWAFTYIAVYLLIGVDNLFRFLGHIVVSYHIVYWCKGLVNI